MPLMLNPADLPQSMVLRRLGRAAGLLSDLSGLLLGHRASGTEDFQLRCLTFALVAGFITCGFFGALTLLAGEPTQATFLALTAVLYALVIVLYRVSRRTSLALNAASAVTFLGILAMMALQGGIHTPTSWWLITMPYLMATTGLHRSAVTWLALSAFAILAFLILDRLGVGPALHLGDYPRVFVFFVQSGLFAVLVFFTLVLSAARLESTRRAEAAYEQAVAASVAKSRFLATMSHEIRTPLNGVIGAAELLRQQSASPAQTALIDTLSHSGEHLRSLIDDILDFSRIEAGMLELEDTELDPGALIRRTVESLEIIARGKGLACECRVAADMPARVRGDAARLRQIAHNLIGNAIKFTAAGRVDIEGAVIEGAAPGRLRLRLTVRDTGVGIAPDKLPRLFKAFSQADGSTTRLFGGSGLGLAISQELARRMHGEIAVSSVPGEGSTFTCTVDVGRVEHAADAAPASAADAGDAPLLEGSRVLLVEDNPVNQALGSAMLEQLGCMVETADNGQIGVECWRDGAYDLVLMDCHMPVMDGLSAARAIRREEDASGKARTPLVALTASAFAEDRAACLDAGMDDFLSKPYTFEQLRKIVGLHAGKAAKSGFIDAV
jgi:signal transduction histidine kinase/CheY-like chemotaxis protein